MKKVNNKNFKYETSFSNIEIKPLVSFERDEYLALASMDKISKLLPEIDTEENFDLLPIAFNACVVNRVNRNSDVVDSETAIAMYKNFVNKQINIEHNREKVIGVILKVGFSEFGTDEPMDEIAAYENKGPFNITLGGVVWRTVNSNVAKIIEDASDPTSENYMKISASWELGFNDYQLVLMDEDERNIENAQVITDASLIEVNKKYLKSMGGSGKNQDGKMIYRKVVGKVLPLGIGLTENPAADVQGVATHHNIIQTAANESGWTITSSQNGTHNVINNIIDNNVMKIEKLEDINDSLLKEVKASEVTDFIQEKLKQASEEFVQEKSALEAKVAEANSKLEELLNNHTSIVDELNSLKLQIAEKEAEERFTVRMARFDEEFELSNDDRAIIASEIADLDEESFEKYSGKMRVLLSSKLKSAIAESQEAIASASRIREIERLQKIANEKALQEPAAPVVETNEEPAEEAVEEVAPEAEEPQEDEEVVESAIDRAEVSDEAIANSTSTQPKSLKEKFAGAFTLEGFKIKL